MKSHEILAGLASQTDAALERFNELGPNGPAAAGEATPELDGAITALLILSGCTARYMGSFWRIDRKEGGAYLRGPPRSMAHRGFTHIHLSASFDEWRTTINLLKGGDKPMFGV